MGLFNFFMQEIAIDLGTANTVIYYEDQVVVDEPSIVAKIAPQQNRGHWRQAQQMHGKTHENIKTVRPLKDGVIADFPKCGGHDQGDDPDDPTPEKPCSTPRCAW